LQDALQGIFDLFRAGNRERTGAKKGLTIRFGQVAFPPDRARAGLEARAHRTDHSVARIDRDVRVRQIYDGASHIQRPVISRALAG
jgi:hypothetical protein